VLPAPDVQRFAPLPNLRVGILTDVPRVSVGADTGVVVWGQNQDGSWSGRRIRAGRATFVTTAPNGGATPPRSYAVQVGSFADEAGARAVAAKAEATASLPSVVKPSADASRFTARVGQFPSRDEAQRLATRLHRDGFPGSFVVQQEAGSGPRGNVRLVETGDELAAATVVPASETERLAVDANAYRGAIEVRTAEGGALLVVNVVGLQDYLKGVVPNELSPQVFPEREAQKAQAVAARTYALRNLGQFAAQGYDLCATATCQVYRGLSSEHPLSSQAVDETRGQVAKYKGELINALYTSTCGGHTEDGANIFDEGAPYLVGVACAPERESWAVVHTTVPPRALGDDPDLTRSVALLTALGVLDPRRYEPSLLRGIPADPEIRSWGVHVSAALKRRGCRSETGALARRGTFFDFLVGALCWEERATRLLSAGDEAYLLRVEDRAAFTGAAERRAAALLMSEGVLSPFPDNTLRPAAAITRAQAFVLLARALEKAGPPDLVSAKFESEGPAGFAVAVGDDKTTHPLDPAVRLYRNLDGVTAAASEISLSAGDAVKLVLHGGEIAYLEIAQTRHGVAADRDSRYYRWEVRETPEEVARGVARYGRVGTVRDLEPRKIGVSGRVVELVVRGSEGDLLLRGLRVRWGLGLRENLFVIERERDPSGGVASFVFTGKGWGHGVGLCQVGAFGMAKAGATFDQILKHYYSGIALEVLD
jgi:stage II sporulation protein D